MMKKKICLHEMNFQMEVEEHLEAMLSIQNSNIEYPLLISTEYTL